jgi:hypothetical protein
MKEKKTEGQAGELSDEELGAVVGGEEEGLASSRMCPYCGYLNFSYGGNFTCASCGTAYSKG